MKTTKLRILRQLSGWQGIRMAIGVVLRKTTKVFTPLYEIESVLEYIYANNYMSRKENNGNVLSVVDDPEIGSYEFFLRRMTSDFAVFQQCLIEKQYRAVRDVVLESFRGDQTKVRYIVDAGANVGCATLYLARSFPQARIIALEPNEGNYATLGKNVDLNNLKAVTTLQKGLWSSDCALAPNLSFRDGREWSYSLVPTESKLGIPGISVPTLMNDYSIPTIDILKIDIEGGEVYLFEQNHVVTQWLEAVRFIAIEVHDINARSSISELLTRRGFGILSAGELTIGLNQGVTRFGRRV